VEFIKACNVANNKQTRQALRLCSLHTDPGNFQLVFEDGGVSLKTCLDEKTCGNNVDGMVSAFASLADFLHQLHLKQEGHFDISLGNILMKPGEDRMRLIDFTPKRPVDYALDDGMAGHPFVPPEYVMMNKLSNGQDIEIDDVLSNFQKMEPYIHTELVNLKPLFDVDEGDPEREKFTNGDAPSSLIAIVDLKEHMASMGLTHDYEGVRRYAEWNEQQLLAAADVWALGRVMINVFGRFTTQELVAKSPGLDVAVVLSTIRQMLLNNVFSRMTMDEVRDQLNGAKKVLPPH
jgi:serine/threonine protein kinase